MVEQGDNSSDGNLDDDSLIVGIGASAGGLAALSELLHHVPTDANMAYVLIQHLDPTQTSLLSELLSRQTAIPVNNAENGMAVQANHAYVIPPNVSMTIAQGQLQLEACERSQPHVKTIDLFFQSLASDQQTNGIAVVLSGSNDDGSLGIEAVRAAGGITFAQAPATAEFPEMPSAAIATGQVDFVLSPARIAEELVNISRHPYIREPTEAQPDQDLSTSQEDELSTVFRLLKRQTGVDFANYKQTTFQRRLQRRIVLYKLSTLAEYVEYLRENSTEIEALYKDALITVTSFFRDPDIYAALQEQVIPTLLQQQQSTAPSIRLWVPGCSTGEEAYSLAICLLESLNNQLISPVIQIFGTDISDQAIEEARLGIYANSRMEGVSAERRRRFFTEVEGGFQINKSVRELCIFARQDLSSDPPFSDIDLVSCRNVLIYFKPALQQRVLSIFHYSLKSTGFLVLGNAESIGDASDLFDIFDVHARIFTRRAVPTRLNLDFVTSHYPPDTTLGQRQNFPASLNRSNIQQWADQILLNRYAPVGVLVNESLDILQFRGETSPYLRPPLGEPSFNLLKMIRPSLLVEVRAAIEEAQQQNVAIKRQQLQLEDALVRDVALEVIPLMVSMDQERCFLILFERSLADTSLPEEARQLYILDEPTGEPDAEVQQFRQELAATRQELLDTQTCLQLTIEEQKSTNQQLIAANEEILSSNEELKSTNEELQTAKEEIQSANEELKTTNEELQSRNAEAHRSNDDLINLINNVNIPILMLSEDLCIRRFSPPMQNLFNLIPSDVGRPISNIRFDVDIPDLEALILEVIDTLNTLEREVQDQNGYWYLLRIRPYRTAENRINGVVIVLIDIDQIKQTECDLRNSQTRLEAELAAMNQVQTLSRQLFSTLDLSQALNQVLDAAMSIHHTDMGCLKLYDPEHDVLEVAVQQGFEPDFLAHFREVHKNDGSPYGRVLATGDRVMIEDVQLDSEFASYCQVVAEKFRAVQITPLIDRKGQLLGVLSTCFEQPYRCTERELRMLELYGRQASDYIQMIRAAEKKQILVEREQAAQIENTRKDEFLSVLSHELRTPLNSILGWVQIVEKGIPDELDWDEAISSIKESALHQLELIEDLLDASRVIQERLAVDVQPTDLSELWRQLAVQMQPQLEQKSLQLEMNLEICPISLAVDPKRMMQVFSNVLSNAIKFTPSGGHIAIQLSESSSQVQVQIRDTGRGIEPDVLPHVFERFRQADASNTRQEDGLGLGLFLTYAIVEAHGGTIAAQSAGEGQGTTITISLPKTRVVEQAEQPTDSATLASATPASATLAEEKLTEEKSLEGVRILLVEDTESALLVISVYLKVLGAVVVTAKSASEALDVIAQQPIDMLVSDIGLPDINGYELIKQVRSLPAEQGGQMPAIALTGYVSTQDIHNALSAGFQRHIGKPLELEALSEAIHSLLQN